MAEQKNSPKEQDISLEGLFKELDQVIAGLEGDDVTLEDSFKLYQKGMHMLKQCNETIDTVEKQVQILDENGEAHEF